MNLYLVVLLSYGAVLIALGLWFSRGVRTTGDFFVAGRRLGPALLFSTMLAANIGAGSTVSAAALGYRDGLSAWWWIGSAGLGSIVLGWWVGPLIRRLAAEHDFRTVGDFLDYRYGSSVRATIAGLLWVGTVAILAAQLIGGAVVLNVVAGIDRWLGCVIAGLVVTVYFAAGGLKAAASLNAIQLVVLLGGFTVVVPLALSGVGGWGAVVAATGEIDDYWNVWQGGGSGWFYLAMLGPAFIVSPGLLQKVYGARDDRAVRVGVLANGVVLLLFAAVPPLLGMMARTLAPDLPSQDLALPTLLMEALPPMVGAPRSGGTILGRGQLGRRDPVHAGHLAFTRSLSSLSSTNGQRCRRPESGAAGGRGRWRARDRPRDRRGDDRGRVELLLHATQRQSVYPALCRPVHSDGLGHPKPSARSPAV